MNDQQFLERAHANPHDDSPEFLQAVADNPQRKQLVAELKQFDAKLASGLVSVSAPEHLKQVLLGIPEDSRHSDTPAANEPSWRRYGALAAGLVIAFGVVAMLLQSPANPMEDMVFTHLYSELSFLDDDTPVSLDDVNALMVTWVGSDFASSAEMKNLEINVGKDCWVDFANGVQGFHLVVRGEVGPVTVMVIPNTPLEEEIPISDDRFEGIIRPTPGGNLVVVGEKKEAIDRYSNLLAGNINW